MKTLIFAILITVFAVSCKKDPTPVIPVEITVKGHVLYAMNQWHIRAVFSKSFDGGVYANVKWQYVDDFGLRHYSQNILISLHKTDSSQVYSFKANGSENPSQADSVKFTIIDKDLPENTTLRVIN